MSRSPSFEGRNQVADSPRLRTYREVVGARVARVDEAQRAGFRGRAYVLASGQVISRRQLEQRAFRLLGYDYRTLEERSRRLMHEHPPGSWPAAVRFWAAHHNQTFRQAAADPRFRGAWAFRNAPRTRARVAIAYERLGIIRRLPSGRYEYTDEFMRWWFQGGLERSA